MLDFLLLDVASAQEVYTFWHTTVLYIQYILMDLPVPPLCSIHVCDYKNVDLVMASSS